VPDDLPPDELTIARAEELLAAPREDRELGVDAETGLPVLVKAGRFGPYVQLGEPGEGSKDKPRTASLFKSMSIETVSLEQALQLLTLPRVVGTDPASGEEITAQNGRYGPYITKGKESRSLASEEELFTVTLDGALALLAQPKTFGRRGAPKPPLKELGDDPVSGQPVVLKDGRFGPYVTDGIHNASLRKGDTVEGITPERAAELLVLRREYEAENPKAKKRTAKKAAAKKTAAKKATAKRAAPKKAAAKKAAPKKQA
jgi:DNA topoisomerase-1